MKLSTGLLSIVSLLLACALPTPPGLLPEPLPRLTPETSCRELIDLEAVDGSVVAVWSEYTGSESFLGRSGWADLQWSAAARTPYAPANAFGSLSGTPEGTLVTARHSSSATEPFELLRYSGAAWETIDFDAPLDWTRQNFPTVVALDSTRMVVDILETNGLENRYRGFILQEGAWVPLPEQAPLGLDRTFHRGTGGALWRATYPASLPGEIRLHQWTGSAWTSLALGIPLEETGYLRRWIPTADGFLARVENTGSAVDSTLFRIGGGTVTKLGSTPPSSDLFLSDLTADSSGRPVIMLSGFPEGVPLMLAMRLEGDSWQTVYELRDRGHPAQLAIQGSDLYLGWSESSQHLIDAAMEQYTDCSIQVVKVAVLDSF